MSSADTTPYRIFLALLALFWGQAACTAAPPESANTAIIAAEIALQRGECASASQDYVSAAAGSPDIKLAARATEVSLDCGQYALAVESAARWRKVAPADRDAIQAAVRAELGRAHVSEARQRLLEWLNSKPAPDDTAITKAITELAGAAGTDITFATLRGLQHPRLATQAVQMQLAELASDAFDHAQALKYVDAAVKAGATAKQVLALRVRAQAGLGHADIALAEARTLAGTEPALGLAEGETLLWLGRDTEAEQFFEDKRTDARLNLAATQRLALLAMARGDYDLAEQRFTELLRDQNTAPTAVYNLAVIAERRGDVDAAIKGYELLARSGLDEGARRRVAGIYLRDGERAQAIRLLSPEEDADTRDRIVSELGIADLLAKVVGPRDAVARIDSALQNYPGHPDLLYQRAVYLEGFDAPAAIAALEVLHRQRPDDMTVVNALGYTLADHSRDLTRAEQLVRTALQAAPDNPAVLDSLGWVNYKRGKSAEALPSLQRAYLLFHDGDIGSHYGEVLWSLGRKDEARALWKRALAADPDNDTLKATTHRFAPELAVPTPTPTPRSSNGTGTSI